MTNKRLVYVYFAIVLAYLATVLFFPLDPAAIQRYQLGTGQLRLLSLSIALPLCAVWSISLYGFIRFKNYAETIKTEKEGKAFAMLATGLMVLSYSFPVNSLLSAVLNFIVLENPVFSDASQIIRGFISLLYQMVAFYILYRGAAELLKILRPKVKMFHTNLLIIGIVGFSSVFTWFIVGRPFGGGSIEETYHMPGWLVLVTIIIPYLYTWYLGLMAARQLNLYHNRISGELYKSILVKLVAGICVIIGVSVTIQVIVSLSERLSRLNFTPILALLYVLLLGYVVGFGLVARSARDLKRIEEV